MQNFRFGSPEHRAFQTADNAWSAELSRAFGKNAGDIRYRPLGKGEPGSTLRAAYDAREAARVAYDRSCGINERGFPLMGTHASGRTKAGNDISGL